MVPATQRKDRCVKYFCGLDTQMEPATKELFAAKVAGIIQAFNQNDSRLSTWKQVLGLASIHVTEDVRIFLQMLSDQLYTVLELKKMLPNRGKSLITGGRGVGKSTILQILRMVATTLSSEEQLKVVFLDFEANRQTTPAKLICGTDEEPTTAQFEAALNGDRTILFLGDEFSVLYEDPVNEFKKRAISQVYTLGKSSHMCFISGSHRYSNLNDTVFVHHMIVSDTASRRADPEFI